MKHTYVLTLSCSDGVGIVAAVTSFIADQDGWIIESSQHADLEANWFFMRVEIKAASLQISFDEFKKNFLTIATRFNMTWKLCDMSVKQRVVILLSKQEHCLADLLYRWQSEEFDFDIAAVISNHANARKLVEWYDVDFHHIAITSANNKNAFQKIEKLFDDYHADVIALARFMQIIPDNLCKKYFGRMLNIHHGFLPSFIGPNAYAQAYNQGVKLVGATCHYITEKLDEGPIIEQAVIRINHQHTIDDISFLCRGVEKNVLARGLRKHVEDRVLIHQNKTIVF